MTQYNIKVLNYPDPPAEETLVEKAARVHFQARRCALQAEEGDVEALLSPKDRPMLQALLGQARARQLLSPAGCDAVERLAAICAATIADLADPDAPATRKKAMSLNEIAEEFRDLASLIADVLDLQAALEMRHRIRQGGSSEAPPHYPRPL